jgi:hypothetical protein
LPALFGLTKRSHYLVLREHPLRARCPCPMCAETAELAIAFLGSGQSSDVRLFCPACSHRTYTEFIPGDSRLQDFPVAMCACEVCDSIRQEWAGRLQDWCDRFSVRLAQLLIETAHGVAGAYAGRGAYRLSTAGVLSRQGVPCGRFVEYLLASTLAVGPTEDAMRSALHWSMHGIFARMLIERFDLRPSSAMLRPEPIDILRHAFTGSPAYAVRADPKYERNQAEQLTRLLAGYNERRDFRTWLAACVQHLGPSRALLLPLTVTLRVPPQRAPWSWRALRLEQRAISVLRKLGYTVIAPND